MTAAPPTTPLPPQHVLVTGGTGFIGRLLVQSLRDEGHTVTVWTRHPATAGFEAAVRCVRRLEDIPQTTAIDAIVNLAGAPIAGPRWTDARKAVLTRSRVGLTETLVGWIGQRSLKPRVLLSGSAIGYYGVQPQGDPAELTEASPPQPVFMSALCQQWEAAAGAASRHGVRVVCMRFGVVLGRHGSLPLLLLPVKFGVAGKLGTGQQCMSWIHVQDLLRALAHVWRIATEPDAPAAPLAYNFTAPGALTQEAFTRTAAEVLHRPFWFPTPGWPLRLALGEQADLMLEGQRVAPARLRETGFQFRFPDARSALQDLR